VLGIHGVPIVSEHVSALAHLCGLLKGQLEGLYLSFAIDKLEFLSVENKMLLLEAIANCMKLRAVCIPQIEWLVGKDSAVLTPMRGVKAMTMLVHKQPGAEFVSSAAFIAPGLQFEVVPHFKLGNIEK
jgi:hypothetical protein